MRRARPRRRKTNDPEVILDIGLRDGMLVFLLTNRGSRPVHEVRVTFRRKVMGLGGGVDIAALPLWSKLAFLPPGKEIEVPIDRASVFLARDKGTPLVASIQYRDADGETWAATITHDFSAYVGFPEIRVR